jgi:isoleucyl-tRNA synthetase
MALAVGRDITYVRVQDKDAVYYLAKDRLSQYYRKETDYESATELQGADLVGRTYEPLFPYFTDRKGKGAFRVLAGDFVSTEDGTGVVHVAPGFGEDDYRLGLAEKLPAVCPVDEEGRFTAEVPDYAGRAVKEADADIVARLKKERKLVKQATIVHSYPHCWRCDTPLIYRAVSTWFVRVEQLKDRMIAANRTVRWVPEHLRDGRFGKWLEGARDWAISRNRYWGTPLPVWRSADGKEVVCIGSIAELEERSGRKVTDLHKHFADALEIPSREGRGMLRRIPEVLDCWFESGAMPYAQAHYPFENKEHFEGHFPADFIAEGLDQTRGWFYTLMVLSVALFDKPAFRNVIVNGLVLAEDGRKMSKRLKNYPDPVSMLNAYGADALRLYLIYSPVVRAEDLRFSEEGVKQLMRHILIPLWNAYSFFVTYANIDGWSGAQAAGTASPNVLDRWIRSSLETLAAKVTAAMDEYDLQRAVRPFVQFIEDLTNWYIRRSRRRFWKSKDDEDKAQAYETLHHVLLELSKIAAPFIPLISEAIYRNLRTPGMPESVHLCDFPVADGSRRDLELEQQMQELMTVVGLGRQLRAQNNMKVRQPLAVMHVVCRKPDVLKRVETLSTIILEELNVKRVEFGDHETALAVLKGKADFKRCGPRFGAKVKKVAAAIASMDSARLEKLSGGESVRLSVDGEDVELSHEDVVVERIPREGLIVAAEGAVLVAIETQLSDELVDEGMAREFVSRIQNMRKTAGLEVTQRIHVSYCCEDDVQDAVEAHTDYIKAETLSRSLTRSEYPPPGGTDVDLNGSPCAIKVDAAV